MANFLLPIVFLLSSTQIIPSAATDTITPSQPLVAGQTLISAGGTFELGFFNASSPSNSFLGIWYHKIPIREIVWVANRRSPITTRNATLSLTTDGNVLITVGIVNGGGGIGAIWSTNTYDIKIPSLKLLDSGNLVLTDGASDAIIWQSFYDPSNAFLPEMKIGLHITATRHVENRLLSWKSLDDPSPGGYTFGIRHTNSSELVVWNGSNILYRTGPWTGDFWNGFPQMSWDYHLNLSFGYEDVRNEIYFTYESASQSAMTLINLDPSGVLQRLVWLGGQWRQSWHMPRDWCDRYGTCGPFGVCNEDDFEGVCRCLEGFEPRTLVDWTLRDYSGGCERKIALNCSERVDGFVKVSAVKLPDTENVTVAGDLELRDCNALCLGQCSCVAYAMLEEGCLWWVGQLIDIKEFAQGTTGVVDLYLRLAATDLDSAESASSKRKHIVAVVIPLGLAFIIFCCCGIYTIRKKRKKGGGYGYVKESRGEEMELSVFDMSAIEISTNHFSDENKLGQGGFGPVYKGHLGDGQEIAVKRLSRYSVQGSDEFMNEVMLIAKLQHRNLVRLLGCCIHGEERLLIYEYMPNKSLDSFIFDKAISSQLGWEKRFDIILGIARGLLYLHQDSRLKIIHRDLKVSNVLLDKELNPKISDFGMARIVRGDQMLESTEKVVGTFGYMSPEYVMHGIFSVKSDVFSFGVIVLEILTGKKNRVFDPNGSYVSLVGHAWRLWSENKSLELVDDALKHGYNEKDVLRCMQVGLLCVQEGIEDRPTMASVVLMLSSESMTLPQPKWPGFYPRDGSKVADFSTVNGVTLTMIHGR
ncbi:G-type lectin S-receptor-like serine/threonine-protein kinase At4g27290 [Dendrobium catenatum]|uniref:Receptor-like serine/threonine-protein kinase n=1 Tax=Dendrobium catenatum TaxID=906689 RepID=A0A2I0VZ11_9ASPA|nr:G-type lectin S-receptor-like serine/threonine-protein kinase At4g27290 [Dendrobium catenatum]PKU68642.1 Receptor-like serine/threonine-protein kinase SD1-6 [Dendrobium catenatum]